MGDPNLTYAPPQQPQSGGNLKIAILFGCVIALLAANVYLFLQLEGLKKTSVQNRNELLEEIGSLREATNVSALANRKRVETLSADLEAARQQAAMAAGQAKVEATKRAEQLAQELAVEQRKLQQNIKQVDTQAQASISEVKGEVGSVKTDLQMSKSQLDDTVAALKRVTGDMGVQSGLVATNGKELQALKALGDRNYFEFNIAQKKRSFKVGDILVVLKNTDTKRNRYTLDVIVDDKRVEKKDRTLNEPVQFYTSRSRLPYELVVYDIKKDQIVGYLATPKVGGHPGPGAKPSEGD